MTESDTYVSHLDMTMSPGNADIFKAIVQTLTLVGASLILLIIGINSIYHGIRLSGVVYYIACIFTMGILLTREGVFFENIKTKPFSPSRLVLSDIYYSGVIAFGIAALKGLFKKHDRVLFFAKKKGTASHGEPAYNVVPGASHNNDNHSAGST